MDSQLEHRFHEFLDLSTKDRFSSKKNVVFGNPDFFCFRRKIAFFVDGDIFHNKAVIKSKNIKNHVFKERLLAGVRRDIYVNTQLKKSGWTVVRISESEIKNHPEYCINLIKKTLKQNED
jgi:G:T-mismatch repair DNA endonuclease (very short patch repair protein)